MSFSRWNREYVLLVTEQRNRRRVLFVGGFVTFFNVLLYTVEYLWT